MYMTIRSMNNLMLVYKIVAILEKRLLLHFNFAVLLNNDLSRVIKRRFVNIVITIERDQNCCCIHIECGGSEFAARDWGWELNRSMRTT